MGRSICALLACGFLAAGTLNAAQFGPAPEVLHMAPEVVALACSPTMVYDRPMASLQITGGQDTFARRIYAPGDLITINAGTDNGIDVGQEFYARRVLTDRSRELNRQTPGIVRTSGWIKVYAVDKKMSLATVTHACDSIEVNDYLEPFVAPVMPTAASRDLKAEKDNYGHILVGTDRRRTFGKGDFFVLDRGSAQGISRGSQFVVYRDRLIEKNYLFELGEAVAVDVRDDSSTLQVTLSRDAFVVGDYVAIRK